jgi:hypothetical protein
MRLRIVIAIVVVAAVTLGVALWSAQGEMVWLVQNLAFCA